MKSVARLSEGHSRVACLVAIGVPHHTLGVPRDYTVCWTNRIRISVVTNRREGERRWGHIQIGEIPTKGDIFA